ncbi:helix-turn-helix domain-containing protein [Kineosporia sp. J2-2]|uniref:Helix-turn-helix domain-containing protein n=1 Tax=Kineosporia corallincola TaxID=2835133 RepID=A0ABS5TI96_9ACTN|nr:AraC family transcriptional regulator [Kineosporia corallincola]MBT0769916.1 helix-turn-helix domain-containing protein [Kineosporia corallincola]
MNELPASPILSIQRAETSVINSAPSHRHPEPVLVWTETATLQGTMGSREWLIPPGYGIWVPGLVEHGEGHVLREGDLSIIHFTAEGCPIDWAEPTGVVVGPLLRELLRHLHGLDQHDPSRPLAEALMFELLTPVATHDIQVTMPSDPRVRAVAEQLLTDPADPRDLPAWADHVHTSVRTLSRLFRTETGMSFADWRTQTRIRAAVHLLGTGKPVSATAHAVGYTRPSAFISAFRRVTGHTPGTYRPEPVPR